MTTATRRTGRPPKNPDEKHFKFKGLHGLLAKGLPQSFSQVVQEYQCDNGEVSDRLIDTLLLSEVLGVSRFTVYRFLNEEKLSKQRAAALIALSGGNITQEELLPYVMRL